MVLCLSGNIGLQGIWEDLATERVLPLTLDFGTPWAAAEGINRILIRPVSALAPILVPPRAARFIKVS